MKAHEVFQRVYERKSPKELAGVTGLSVSTLHKWAETGESHRTNPLELVSLVTHATGDLILVEWTCREANGFFVKNVTAAPTNVAMELLPAVGRLTEGVAEFEKCVAQVEMHGEASNMHSKNLRAAWEVLKSAGECFVAACERGVFRLALLLGPLAYWFAAGDAPELAA